LLKILKTGILLRYIVTNHHNMKQQTPAFERSG
jgi:hypothetical protein